MIGGRPGLLAALQHRRARRLAAAGRLAEAHYCFARAAKRGHIEAQFALAQDYHHGRGCGRSGSEALRWYYAAADRGHVEAQFEVGLVLLGGRGLEWCAGSSARWLEREREKKGAAIELIFPRGGCIKKDESAALAWLRRAAEAGKPEAQANLGWLLLKGVGCKIDRIEARRWFSSAAQRDVSQAALGLADLFGAEGTPEFDAQAQRIWLRRAADLGNASAAYKLGIASQVDGSEGEAEHYLMLAAGMNHAAACRDLGQMLLARSSDEATERGAEYLRRAAKCGHIGAAAELGELYSRGDRVKPDLREAAHWLCLAADAGLTQPQFQVGCFFARGEGVPKDLHRAAHYFRLSAEGGHLIGALNLGIFHETGEGVLQDFAAAEHWLSEAARGGVPQAQVRLAHLKASGRHGPPDIDTAIALLEQAVSQKHSDAELALAKLLLAERSDLVAQKRADELLASAVAVGSVQAADAVVAHSDVCTFTPETITAAINCLEKASHAGNALSALALVALARANLKRLHRTSDPDRAEQLLKQAAHEGYVIAHFELGVLYCQRNKSAIDLKLGFKHYQLSAELGHPMGQFNTAVMLLNGTGVEPDRREAIAWLKVASELGLKQASSVLERMAN